MPRPIVLGNGNMLVNFDHDYNLRNLYYPYAGMENHLEGRAGRPGSGGYPHAGPFYDLPAGVVGHYHRSLPITRTHMDNRGAILAFAASMRAVQNELAVRTGVGGTMPGGGMPGQVHPYSGEPLSVAPLTWSHAGCLSAVLEYLDRYGSLHQPPSGRTRRGKG